jgi:hypothetical protein
MYEQKIALTCRPISRERGVVEEAETDIIFSFGVEGCCTYIHRCAVNIAGNATLGKCWLFICVYIDSCLPYFY